MIQKEKYKRLLLDIDNAKTNHEKGQSLELFSKFIFNSLDGVQVVEHDIHTESEEIDLVLYNAKIDECFRTFDDIVLVECKNWSKPANAPSLDSFISKLRRRSLSFGIFIAANGVTGDFINGNNGVGAVDIIKQALSEGIRVIILNLNDFREILDLDQLRNLIIKRYCGLFVYKILQE